MCNGEEKKCGVCKIDFFERNNYYYGKLMTVRDYFDEQCYFNEKRWLINRMILGWGVVCGLDVVPDDGDPTKVIVKRGLAIDCCGRELLVCEEQVVDLVPQDSQCHKQKQQNGTETKLVVCIEYFECKSEPVHLPPIACDQKERGEFNRIRDSFKIRVVPMQEKMARDPIRCPDEMESMSLHQYLCGQRLKDCPECPDSHCVVLAVVTVNGAGSLTGKIDACSQRRLVYGNSLLYELIECLHRNYVGTWLVLGPIFNVTHQTPHHASGDGHPAAKDIITQFDTSVFDPGAITSDIGNCAPRHGDVIHYKNGALDISGEYTWQTRNFIGMDWMNIHDIEDNIHQHLPGDYADPHDTKSALNFSGKHHVMAYFLVYIVSPAPRTTRLYVRSDDSLRVWLNGGEIVDVKYTDDRDITDYREVSAIITLKEGTNILMAAVAETHYEWGFSARLEDDGGLRFTPVKPE